MPVIYKSFLWRKALQMWQLGNLAFHIIFHTKHPQVAPWIIIVLMHRHVSLLGSGCSMFRLKIARIFYFFVANYMIWVVKFIHIAHKWPLETLKVISKVNVKVMCKEVNVLATRWYPSSVCRPHTFEAISICFTLVWILTIWHFTTCQSSLLSRALDT